MSQNYLAAHFTCPWPWTTLVLLCDGRIVCGCADPYARRVLGDARVQTIHEIWTGPGVTGLREEINRGGSAFCGDCPLRTPVPAGAQAPQRPLDVPPLPSRLYVEPTVACNLSCYESCCAPETGIARTRQAGMLDFDLFRRVVEETGSSLVRLDFFNYGEAFLHRQAVEMCEYVKARFPQVYLYTSTNGLAFTDEGLCRLARSGIDEITFSVDGASQGTYERYRRRGDFGRVLRNMRLLAGEKRAAGRDVPIINWRYILFSWNDSDEEMNRARELAAEIGVDRLSWELTDHPEAVFSRRFLPGTPGHAAIRHEIWDDNNLGNAIPGATPRARIDVFPLLPRLPLTARRGSVLRVRTRVSNQSTRPFRATASYGRRLVRLGAQLHNASGALIERDYARAWLPADVPAGGGCDVLIEMTAPVRPGRYRLKFDLVSEGIDWFEACGSGTTSRGLWTW